MPPVAITVIGPGGQPVPPPTPQPSEVQRWHNLAAADIKLSEALIFFHRDTMPDLRASSASLEESKTALGIGFLGSTGLLLMTLNCFEGRQTGLGTQDARMRRPRSRR